jgi:hypothetical protein
VRFLPNLIGISQLVSKFKVEGLYRPCPHSIVILQIKGCGLRSNAFLVSETSQQTADFNVKI